MPFLVHTTVANFNYTWQGTTVPFPSSGVSTQVQFGPQTGSQLHVPGTTKLQQSVQPSMVQPPSVTINYGAMNL